MARLSIVMLVLLSGIVVSGCAGSGISTLSPTAAGRAVPSAVTASEGPPSASPSPTGGAAPPSSSASDISAAPAASAGSPPAAALSVVGLGDSIPGGLGCSCRVYVALLGDEISKALKKPVTVSNLATNDSLESGELLGRVRGMYREYVASADLITITIGVNDWQGPCNWPNDDACWASGAAHVEENLRATLVEIGNLRAGKPTAIRVTDYFNWEIGDPEAPPGPEFQAFFAKELARFNAMLCRVATANGAVCIDLVPAFNGPDGTKAADEYLLSPGNHLHLNQAGEALIAKAIAAAGYAPLR